MPPYQTDMMSQPGMMSQIKMMNQQGNMTQPKNNSKKNTETKEVNTDPSFAYDVDGDLLDLKNSRGENKSRTKDQLHSH